MKHKLGYHTWCNECFYYIEKSEADRGNFDGYCRKGFKLNGKNINEKPRKVQRFSGWHCDDWEDAENRLTYFEVKTRTPGPWRSELEQEEVARILRKEGGKR